MRRNLYRFDVSDGGDVGFCLARGNPVGIILSEGLDALGTHVQCAVQHIALHVELSQQCFRLCLGILQGNMAQLGFFQRGLFSILCPAQQGAGR